MFFTAINRLMQLSIFRYRIKFWTLRRTLFSITFTLIFALISIIMKKICWKVYLLFPHCPEQAWMDSREQALMIKHLQGFNATISGRPSIMLEYGAGSSTFVYSAYVNRYVSIEHSVDYCRLFERMAACQSNRSITISYMESHLSGFVEKNRFEQNPPQSGNTPSIHIYCILSDVHSILFHRFWRIAGRSTYLMYRNYVDFVSMYLHDEVFDFVLVDGRARPQAAYAVLKQLNGLNAKVFVHDWNDREEYHVIVKEFYDIVEQQIESNQVGGGGLVVLKEKPGVTGEAKIDEIQWKTEKQPNWWL